MAKRGSVLATAPVGGAGRVAGPSTPGTGARTPPRGAEWWLDRRNPIVKPEKSHGWGWGAPEASVTEKSCRHPWWQPAP